MQWWPSAAAFALAAAFSVLPVVSATASTVDAHAAVDPSQCGGLPRNTFLASCPAPCLPDAPCIVYDQDAEHSKLTGCDYDTANPNSFCFSTPGQSCEFHCFPKHSSASAFDVIVTEPVHTLGEPKPRTTEGPAFLDQPDSARQANNFVFSIGQLNLSEKISDVSVAAIAPEHLDNIDVSPSLLAGTKFVTSLSLFFLPLGSIRAAAIIASAPPTLRDLNLGYTLLESLSWKTFAHLPHLEILVLLENRIPLVTGGDSTMPALTNLDLSANTLSSFDLRAPELTTLDLGYNKLVRIPESVFAYTKLEWLHLVGNPLIRPLVLTRPQLEFLEALPGLLIELVDSPDAGLISRLPISGANVYGNYSDDVDISLLLDGATEALLQGEPSLPVRIVDPAKAETYNNLLEQRARARAETSGDIIPTPATTPAASTRQPSTTTPTPSITPVTTTLGPSTPSPNPPSSTHPPVTSPVETEPPPIVTSPPTPIPTRATCPLLTTASPVDDSAFCQNVPRNTVLSSCPAPCLPDAPCIVYDQDATHSMVNGCDYNTSSSQSICSIKGSQTQTCEVHCFAPATPKDTFGFVVPFNATAPGRSLRCDDDPKLIEVPASGYLFQSNDFVFSIGKLNLSTSIREINITGGTQPGAGDKYVSVDVDPNLLAGVSSVSTVTLASLPLGNSRVAAIVASAPRTLKNLFLPRTKITALSKTLPLMPNLEVLSLSENQIRLISRDELNLPSVTRLSLDSNVLTQFTARAPNIVTLDLKMNKLVCIPQSVFTYSKLKSLNLTGNPIVRPLILTATQVQFLEALPDLAIGLVDVGTTGLMMTYDDIYEVFQGSRLTHLHGNPLLPVRLVDEETATNYNTMLESWATYPRPRTTLPVDICDGLRRHTLLVNCKACSRNAACVVYDQDTVLSQISGCDYDIASTSYCSRPYPDARTCEFQCFPVYEEESQFKFFIPFKAPLGEPIQRNNVAKASQIPYVSNTFVTKLGSLNSLSPSVTNIMISGGRTDKGSRGRVADVSIDAFSYGSSVTTLAFMNIDLSTIGVAPILSPNLKSLNVRNTRLASLPEGVFAKTPKLETLTLSQNDLASLSAETMMLPELKTLDLSENALEKVDLYAPKLKTLDLSGNYLRSIPASVFTLSELETLYLDESSLGYLALTREQTIFLNSVPDVRFFKPAPPLAATVTPTGVPAASITTTTTPSTSSPPASFNGSGLVAGDNPLLAGGILEMVKGVPVIIVNESAARQFNEQLEQQQRESPLPRRQPTPDTAAPSGQVSEPQEPSSVAPDPSSTSSDQRPPSTTTGGSVDSTRSTNPSSRESQTATEDDLPSLSRTANDTNHSVMMKILFLGLGSTLLVAVVVLFVIYTQRGKAVKNPAPESYQTLSDNNTPDESISVDVSPSAGKIVAWWKDDVMLSHRLRASDIGDQRVISSDASGIVWLVNFRGGSRQLVSRRVIPGEGPVYEAKVVALFAEAKIAASLNYRSIVPLVGVAWTDKTDLQVLYEYMPNGDVGSLLAETSTSSLPWLPDKLQLAIDIIEALVYTHSFNPQLLHRDLKASNVLLDEDFKAKLGGFGCARVESENNTMTTTEIGTGRWLAPEILAGSTNYGSSSDIYAFGVVLCELDTHQVPYVDVAAEVSEATLLQRVARGELRPSLSSSCPPEIREVAEACLAFDPDNRPNAMQISHTLRSLRSQGSK